MRSSKRGHNPAGYQLAGMGGPSVVLETGFGAESSSWGGVVDLLAADHQVLTYDRPGRGGSERPARARDVAEIASDLRELLAGAGLDPPYILVGQSFGGIIARVFADSFPDETSRLVLVESMHRHQFALIGPLFPQPADFEPTRLSSMRGFWQGGWRDPENNPESIDLQRCFDRDTDIATLGDLPLDVVTGEDFRTATFLPSSDGERMQSAWNGLQRDIASLSSRASRTTAAGSGHFVQLDRPDVIAACVRNPGQSPADSPPAA